MIHYLQVQFVLFLNTQMEGVLRATLSNQAGKRPIDKYYEFMSRNQ